MQALIPLPAGQKVLVSHKAVIVHAMAEYIDTDPEDKHAIEFLRSIGLSAHAFVTPTGLVIRSRDNEQGAYHAKGWNNKALGIELLVPGLHTYASFAIAIAGKNWVSPDQFRSAVRLVAGWKVNYPSIEILRHSDVSPGRKIDPGAGFNWKAFLDSVDQTIRESKHV